MEQLVPDEADRIAGIGEEVAAHAGLAHQPDVSVIHPDAQIGRVDLDSHDQYSPRVGAPLQPHALKAQTRYARLLDMLPDHRQKDRSSADITGEHRCSRHEIPLGAAAPDRLPGETSLPLTLPIDKLMAAVNLPNMRREDRVDKDLKRIVEALKAAGYQVVHAAAGALGGLHRRRGTWSPRSLAPPVIAVRFCTGSPPLKRLGFGWPPGR